MACQAVILPIIRQPHHHQRTDTKFSQGDAKRSEGGPRGSRPARHRTWNAEGRHHQERHPADGGIQQLTEWRKPMCVRITQTVKPETLAEQYGLDLTPHYNGAPGQRFVAVRATAKGWVLTELQ